MISQRCPKCNSSRVRAGYRPTPIYLKLLFRYYLLCNNCNWEFTGFAVPGTVSSKTKSGKKKATATAVADKTNNAAVKKYSVSDGERIKTKKRVKIKIRA